MKGPSPQSITGLALRNPSIASLYQPGASIRRKPQVALPGADSIRTVTEQTIVPALACQSPDFLKTGYLWSK